jgi:sugar O-acyltransferase (sialic acid O-acetyltransferase NeuD family)
MKQVVIIGAGGFGRETLDIFDAWNSIQRDYEVLGFVVQPEYGVPGQIINDIPILGDFGWLETYSKDVWVTCAVGASHHRRRLVEQVSRLGCRFCNIVHPSVIKTRWTTLAEDIIIAAGCILTNQIRIGNHVHINLGCTIGHDVVIEDFVTLAPGVHVSGNVTLREGCYVGTGANIIEKKNVGEWSIIGAGSVIVEDVPSNSTVVGVPGSVIKTRSPGWHLQ